MVLYYVTESWYCIIMVLYYHATVSWYCVNMALSWLCYCIIMVLYYPGTVFSWYCIILVLYHCNVFSWYYIMISIYSLFNLASCPDPPSIENGDFIKEKRDDKGVITELYYQCSRQYTLSFTGSIRCQNGKWPSPPKCLRKYIIFNWSENGVISTCQVYVSI